MKSKVAHSNIVKVIRVPFLFYMKSFCFFRVLFLESIISQVFYCALNFSFFHSRRRNCNRRSTSIVLYWPLHFYYCGRNSCLSKIKFLFEIIGAIFFAGACERSGNERTSMLFLFSCVAQIISFPVT